MAHKCGRNYYFPAFPRIQFKRCENTVDRMTFGIGWDYQPKNSASSEGRWFYLSFLCFWWDFVLMYWVEEK